MRKFSRFIPVATLICAGSFVTMTSCVDDKESQSVTDLRDAKTQGLLAQAELDKAKAQVELIYANAEKALKEAQAEEAKARAKVSEAEAAQILAQTEADQAMAALTLQIAQVELAERQAVSATIIANAEIELEQAKLNAQIKKIQLEAELELVKNQDPVLVQAIADYTMHIGVVNTHAIAIASKELDVKKLEALLADGKAEKEDALARRIRGVNEAIANEEKAKTENTITLDNYKLLLSKAGATNLEKEIAEAKAARNLLIYSSTPLYNTWQEKVKITEDAIQAVKDFRGWTSKGLPYSTLKSTAAYIPIPGSDLYEGTYYTLGELNVTLAKNKEWLSSAKKTLDENTKEYDKAAKEVEKNYTDAKASDTQVKETQDALTKAETEKNLVYANPSATQAQKDAANAKVTIAQTTYSKAIEDRQKAWSIYNDAQAILDSKHTDILQLKNNVEYIEKTIQNLEITIAAYKGKDQTPYDLEKAIVVAYENQKEAREAYNNVDAEVSALNTIINKLQYIHYTNGGTSVDALNEWITNTENAIKENDEQIAYYKRQINKLTEDMKVDVATLENAIAEVKAEIAKLKVERDAEQKLADAAKAVIDAKTKK